MCEQKKKYKTQDISSGNILCNVCKEKKPLENYYMSKGYYIYVCKSCLSEKYKSKRPEPIKKSMVVDGKKKCTKCGEFKEVSEFPHVKGKYSSNKCRKCTNLYHQSKKVKTEDRLLFEKGLKKCRLCHEIKPFELFPVKNPKSCRESRCSKCANKLKTKNRGEKYYEYQKKYFSTDRGQEVRKKIAEKQRLKKKEEKRLVKEERNKQKEIILQEKLEKRKSRELEWELKRQEKVKKKLEWEEQMEYYKSDEWKKIKKEKESKKRYERWKKRWNEDESFAIKVRLRNLIRNSFRRGGYKKFEKKTESIVGMNYDEFKLYLESKFVDGMSWDNRGEWHIDHIIPLSTAKSEEELISLCHYSNLQPLWGKDNISKSDKIL
jgi:hypothetical protein